MTQPSPSQRPEQLRLWPASDADALLYQTSSSYRKLDEVGQRIVRSYLLELDRIGNWPTQSAVALAAGVSRSTVSARLSDVASPAWQAITEILVASRDELARRSTIAIPALAALILRAFLPGEGRIPRSTSTLTRVELDVLKLASLMGGVALGPDGQPASLAIQAVQQGADGQSQALQVSVTQGVSLSDMLNKLRGDVAGQEERAGEPESPKYVQQAVQQAAQAVAPMVRATGGDGGTATTEEPPT